MRPIVAKDLMNSEVLTVREDLPIRELTNFFLDNEITGAPVEGSDGTVVGVVSLVDIARASSEPAGEAWEALGADYYDKSRDPHLGEEGMQIFRLGNDEVRVRDIMNKKLHSVGLGAEVPEVAGAMLRNHIHRLLVIEDNELVGVISTSDLIGLLVDDKP